MVFNFRKSIGNPINKTFSKRNTSTFFNKTLPDNVIKGGEIGGTILGSTGAGVAGIGYLSGNPALIGVGKGLGAGGAILKGSAGLTKGIQSARKY